MTVNELSTLFMTRYARDRLRPSTERGYLTNFQLHILPTLGEYGLEELSPDQLDDLTEELREKGLSSRSILYVHATLRKALNYAVKRGLLVANPYGGADLPRIEDYRYRVLTETEIHRLLDSVPGTDPLNLGIRLSISYGLRRGEVLGLIPELDLDSAEHILHIQRTRTVEHGRDSLTPCKTKHSNRYILLFPEDSEVLASLPGGYAVPLTPTQLDKRFKRFLADGGFPNLRFHDLRHSYATLMLKKGVNPKLVSSVLGHSGIAITLNIYSHPDVRMQSTCLDAFNF